MRPVLSWVGLVMPLPVLLTGCMTIVTQNEFLTDIYPVARVYSGTAGWVKLLLAREPDLTTYLFSPFDIALCLVADTVLLPYTIPMQLIHGDLDGIPDQSSEPTDAPPVDPPIR